MPILPAFSSTKLVFLSMPLCCTHLSGWKRVCIYVSSDSHVLGGHARGTNLGSEQAGARPDRLALARDARLIFNNSGPVKLFWLIINPQRFSQSGGNLFQLPYLFRDRFCERHCFCWHSLTRWSSRCASLSRHPENYDRYPDPCPFHLSFEDKWSPQNQPTLCPRLLTFDKKCMPSLAHLSYRLSCI
ncbi:hypothetical protein F4604DRAFT_1816772 [Suillus subluteus]|nr:hypothetical protein F4604DRAFT_1816772 [Suillus subluteus]